MCLEVAALCKNLSKVFITDQNDYDQLFNIFTDSALNMMNDFKSDQQAAFALTEIDAMFHSPLYVAIKSRNIKFIASSRILRIVNHMWSQPFFMKQEFSSSGRS